MRPGFNRFLYAILPTLARKQSVTIAPYNYAGGLQCFLHTINKLRILCNIGNKYVFADKRRGRLEDSPVTTVREALESLPHNNESTQGDLTNPNEAVPPPVVFSVVAEP
jgi:hypothetical protein